MKCRVLVSLFILCAKTKNHLPSAKECAEKPRLSETLCTYRNTSECHGKKGLIFCDGKCIDLDECSQHNNDPCGHRGICHNHDSGYSCECLEGWNGTDKHCSYNVTDHPHCMPGYHGDHCQTAMCGDHGHSGRVGIGENYTCVCEEGWKRVADSVNATCDLDIDECVETPDICHHGASCLNLNGSYTCLCNNEWYGCNCTQYNCTYGGCANGGVCINDSCSCPMVWSGENCSLLVNESLSSETTFHVPLSTPQQSVETAEKGNHSSTPFLVEHDNQTSTQFIVAHDNQTSTPNDVAHDKKTLTPIVVSTVAGIFLVGMVMAVYYRLKIKKRTAPSFA